MTWGIVFRSRQYLKESLWVIPLTGVVLGFLIAYPVVQLDQRIALPSYWQYSPSTASNVLSAMVGAMAALAGFVVTVSVLAVQTATGTFSPRYLRLWYRDGMLKALLALLVGTLTFSFQLLRRITTSFVPNLGVTAAGVLLVASLLLFMLFFDRFLHRLRPVAVAALVASSGRQSFAAVVRAAAAPDAPDLLSTRYESADEPILVVRSTRSGAIQAIDDRGLVRWARSHDCLLVLPHLTGDFLSSGSTLIEVYGATSDHEAAERSLRGMVVLGVERTIEQDPAFAIRIMVDIAIRALSAAVNDPTTAVQVLNHLGETLRLLGSTVIGGVSSRGDAGNRPAVLVRRRRWEDYLALGVTEIREYGGTSLQVNRRLRAMLEDLHREVLPEHRAAVAAELARLDATVTQHFGDSIDLDLASTADRQGIGGPAGHPAQSTSRGGAATTGEAGGGHR